MIQKDLKKRADLLKLIHAFEEDHQSYAEAQGFDAYRAQRTEDAGELFDGCCTFGSIASQLRTALDRFDKHTAEYEHTIGPDPRGR